MSHIDKLGILGIRSFSHEEPQYIKFLSPFTLIVGANGTGKTTIIECLKYACTGDQPPNSKGGAFIHDTKLAGVKEIKAQVKLSFIDVDGQRIFCSRSLSLTQTRTKATLKTLDSSLQRYNPTSGETFSISSRCADMDTLLPIHLGVPKAILENVIFCHQEDSNWPLSEPAVLKKKFDDIFASTKYTKALDSIKDIRKERAQDMRTDQVRLEGLKTDTIKAQRLQADVVKMQRECEEKQECIQELEKQIHETTTEIERLLEVHQQSQELANKITQVSQQKALLEANLTELETELTDRNETNEELQSLLQEQSTKTAANLESRQQLEAERDRLDQQLRKVRDDVSSKLTEIGRLQANADNHKQSIDERNNLIRDISRELGLGLSSFSASQTDPAASITAIRQFVTENEKKALDIKLKGQEEQNRLSDELQSLKSERAGLDQTRRLTQRDLEKDKETIRSLTNQLDEIQVSQVEMNMEKDKIVKQEARLAERQANFDTKDITALLSQKERRLRELDDQISNLNDEMSRLSLQGDTHARLALKQSDRDTKLAAARSIFEQCKNYVAQRLGIQPTLDHLEKELKTLLNKNAMDISSIQHQQYQANRDLSAVETMITMTRKSISEKQTEANALEQTIQTVCPDASLPNELKKVDDAILDLRNKMSSLSAAELLYARFVKKAESSHHCPLCSRQFSEDSEFKFFIDKLQSTVDRIPNQKVDYAQRVEDMETKQQRLRALQNSWTKMETLRKEDIPDSEKKLSEYEQNYEGMTKRMDKIAGEMEQAIEDKKWMEKVYKLSEDAVRQQREAAQLNKEIERLEADLRKIGSTRTITDCQRELEDLADQSKTVRKEIKRLHDDREISLRNLQQMENDLRDYQHKLTRLQHQLDTKANLEERLATAQNSLSTNTNAFKDCESRAAPLEAQVAQVASALEDSRRKWNTKYDQANHIANQCRQQMERLNILNARIDKYERSGGSTQLNVLTEEKLKLDTRTQVLAENFEGRDKDLREVDKELTDQQGKIRELKDHLRYRSIKQQLKTCELELKEYQQQSQQFRKATYEQKLELLKDRQSQLIATRGGLEGEIRQMRDHLRRCEDELKNDYRNIEDRYNKQFLQVKTNEMAVNDLEKYTKALQQAIMRYHSLKMEDLNKIIKELWMSTYRGGDIDYIEIRSDAEGATAANRSYNYRVVMIKDGKEMNIRGRCSAGQKVLAAIIIRLALAETFCINCGVLTLDEPTTNLDRANMESLADNLAKIIQTRRAQSNFQLVVITHDEDFVECLSRAEIADSYYRIIKDENQCSVIRQESFAPM